MEQETAAILIVDDDPVVRNQLRYHISKIGYTVAGEAEKRPSSLDKAKKLCPDIVIMDVIMDTPDACILAAKDIYEEPGIPIVFLTIQLATEGFWGV